MCWSVGSLPGSPSPENSGVSLWQSFTIDGGKALDALKAGNPTNTLEKITV